MTANDWFCAYIYYQKHSHSPFNRACELLLSQALALQLPGKIESELDFIDDDIVAAYTAFVQAVARGEQPSIKLPT